MAQRRSSAAERLHHCMFPWDSVKNLIHSFVHSKTSKTNPSKNLQIFERSFHETALRNPLWKKTPIEYRRVRIRGPLKLMEWNIQFCKSFSSIYWKTHWKEPNQCNVVIQTSCLFKFFLVCVCFSIYIYIYIGMFLLNIFNKLLARDLSQPNSSAVYDQYTTDWHALQTNMCKIANYSRKLIYSRNSVQNEAIIWFYFILKHPHNLTISYYW